MEKCRFKHSKINTVLSKYRQTENVTLFLSVFNKAYTFEDLVLPSKFEFKDNLHRISEEKKSLMRGHRAPPIV